MDFNLFRSHCATSMPDPHAPSLSLLQFIVSTMLSFLFNLADAILQMPILFVLVRRTIMTLKDPLTSQIRQRRLMTPKQRQRLRISSGDSGLCTKRWQQSCTFLKRGTTLCHCIMLAACYLFLSWYCACDCESMSFLLPCIDISIAKLMSLASRTYAMHTLPEIYIALYKPLEEFQPNRGVQPC